MNKTVIVIIFSVIFASFTIVPSILAIVDDSYDISILISSTEEEEKKGEEKVKDFEIEEPSKQNIEYNSYTISSLRLLNELTNNYSSLFKELTSPPPEVNI